MFMNDFKEHHILIIGFLAYGAWSSLQNIKLFFFDIKLWIKSLYSYPAAHFKNQTLRRNIINFEL